MYRTRATITRSWLLTIHNDKNLGKKLFKKTFFSFKNRVKSIQTAGYNGTRTVDTKYFCLYLVLFHFTCFHAVSSNSLETTFILFELPYSNVGYLPQMLFCCCCSSHAFGNSLWNCKDFSKNCHVSFFSTYNAPYANECIF
jgi:hypothetical protein